ncbi:S-layer homology domain-containing protein [Paenibacillus piri]|uniref:S-layer homology domain-containing protein n=1 Tax=Paenibacillus piri TaxID=2547395 RepID=A0A4R5KRE5_9BACL|nr:S-layer homology domain-containing protein [Paenibacillus piri]TDF97555.1 S-layer homology domain-containing protein [Paenibacillus piri]
MKKSLSLILSAAMAFSMYSSVALGAGKSSADFSDLANLDAAAKVKFDAMISAGIFDGVGEGNFGLKDKMNRAQFAKAAALVFGLPVDSSLTTSSFGDVRADDPANGYALPYIEALKKANLTDGYGANTYNPAGEVTKEQLAAFLIRGLNKDAEGKAAQGANDATVSGWAQGYASLAKQLKLMDNGSDGTFGGTAAADRELLVTSSYAAKQQYVPGSGSASKPVQPSGGNVISTGDLPTYNLNANVKAQAKGVLQEKTANGWRFGAVVKLSNTSGSTTRVPDHELRVKASDGSVYTLKASTDNVKSIEPQSTVELTFMTEIDKTSDFNLTNLLWVDVDDEVYPKKETVLADAPIENFTWHGTDAVIQDSALLGSWGTGFTVPGETSPLKYTATNLTKQFSGQSPTYIVQVKVENPSNYAATVPNFTLSGKAKDRSYVGNRVEQSAVVLNPGEQKYINFAVTTEPDTQLTAFYVLSTSNFLKQGATAPVQFYTGRIGFTVPASGQNQANLPAYTLGSPIAIDTLSKAVNPQMQVALQDIEWFENDGRDYKTAVAKIKFTNNSGNVIPVPQLGAEIVSDSGVSYDGVQSTSSVNDVLPGMGSVQMFAFTVPQSEKTNQFTLRLLEQQGKQTQPAGQSSQSQAQAAQGQAAQGQAAQGQAGQSAAAQAQPSAAQTSLYKTPIAQVYVTINTTSSVDNVFSFYPYEMRMDSFNVSNYAAKNGVTNSYGYTYKLEMGIDIKSTDAVLADPSNPKLLFQLEGPDGKRLGSKTFALTGDNRLMSGNQSIMFDSTSDTLEAPVSIKVYELVTTPYGDARHLLTTLKD